MNNKKSTLSKEQQDKAIAWLNQHWKANKVCEICQTTKWTVLEDVITPMVFSGAFAVGKAYPQFMVMCNTCGNTKYFNAIASGIVDNIKGDKNG